MKPVSVETCIDRQRSMLRRRTFVGLAAVGVCAVSAFAEPAVAGIGLGLVIVGVVLVPGAWARWRRLGEADDWVRGQAVLQVTGAHRSKRSTVTLQLPDRAVVAPVVSI